MRSLIFILCCILMGVQAHAQKRIALTFDDVPRQKGAFLSTEERTTRLIAALDEAGVKQAAFFVNAGFLETPDGEGGEARINAYVNAGHVLANHSFSHPHLNAISASDYVADIDRNEAWLKGRKGYRPWFRFPYLDEGGTDKVKRDAVRTALRNRKLQNGYVTADGSDWHLEALTIEAAKAGKTIDVKALRRLYISSQMSNIEYYHELARRTLGREPAHVMLMHETDIAALFIADLVAELKRQGWTIISADEAFADPIASAEPDTPFAAGTLTGSMAWEKNIEPPMWPVAMNTATMSLLFENNVAKAVPTPAAAR